MEPQFESAADEVARLRGCLSDVVSIMALPAEWAGRDPEFIGSTLADALLGMLGLAFVFVRLNEAPAGHTKIARFADSVGDRGAQALGNAVDSWIGAGRSNWPAAAGMFSGAVDMSVASARLGLHGEIGMVVAGSERRDFPAQTETLLLELAANHATIGLQQALILEEQKGLTIDLDGRVTDRTAELTTANELLKKEIAERRRTEDALRDTEHQSQLVVDSIPGMVALLTAGGDIEFVNRQLLEYFGQTLEQLRNWGTNDTIHPDDLHHVLDVFTQSIASGNPYDIVQRFKRADGVYRWFANRGFPVRDDNGGVVRWCVLLTDIDERKRAEDALRESERESRLIVDSIPGLVAGFTHAGEVEFVNRQIREYFGATLDELKRWETGSTTHPEDLPRAIELFTRSIVSGEPFEFELRARRFDGVYRWFQSRGFPLRDTNGDIVRWYNLLIDVDERKRAEDALGASERNLKLIIDTIPALAWSARMDGSADFFNQHYLDFIGLSAADASGSGWTAAVHPEDLSGLAATWQRIIVSEAPGEAEARLRRHDGEYRWFLFRVNPFRDESGEIVKWYGINTDIEDRRRAEDGLRAREHDLRLMTETIPEMLWSATPAGAIDYCNTRFLRYTGFSAGEVMGDGWQQTIHPDDAARVAPVWMSCVATGVEYRVEVRTFHAADRTYRLCAVTALPLLDEQGQIVKWHGTIVDMEDWKQAQEELRNTQAALAHATRVATMGELTASIAHEINQPLSGIITNANTCLKMLAAEPPDVNGARETARRTIRDGKRASEVIERLRALFKKKEVTTEAVELNDAIQEVIALASSDLNKHQVILRCEFADDLPAVSGDRVQLQQVVLNLLMNASEAMSSLEGDHRQLRIRTEHDGSDHVRVTVQDTGVGFEPQGVDRLFEAFYTTKTTGMGIGLSVSRSIIARHNGRIWAALNDGPGATFAFSIPRRPVEVMSAGDASV